MGTALLKNVVLGIETFENILKEGPASGHVSELERIGPNSGEPLDEFEIRFG